MNTELEPISLSESEQRIQCENKVHKGQQTFIEVGEALLTLRDNRLYRNDFSNFESYCKSAFGWSASRARQLVAASEAAKSVTNGNGLNERQARELARVPAEKRAEVLAKAGNKPTARKIREAAIVDIKPISAAASQPDGRTVPCASENARTEQHTAGDTDPADGQDAGSLSETAETCVEMCEISIENFRALIDAIKDGSLTCDHLKDVREHAAKTSRWLHALTAERC